VEQVFLNAMEALSEDDRNLPQVRLSEWFQFREDVDIISRAYALDLLSRSLAGWPRCRS
jgi:hypothetical protein